MGKIAFLFAGQGAQSPGMGETLCDASASAAAVFGSMEKVRPGTRADCFEAEAEHLQKTSVTQPCVFTVDLAAAEALRSAGVEPEGVAGFSLGEMAALTFAGAFSFAEGAGLVCLRGEVMERAAAQNPGAMAAVLRLPDEAVEALCEQHEGVWPVNYNCPGQLVVAAREDALPAFCDAVKAQKGMARKLPVGGAFHTPLMAAASQEFLEALRAADMRQPRLPVYANRTAAPYEGEGRELLAQQMCAPVRWHESVRRMAADGFDTFVEVGPGKTLTGFVKRILPEASLYNVQDDESLAETLDALS